MKNIVLIGMPATGKSTVGVILAKLMGFDFIDTDVIIAAQQRRPLPQIVADEGYERFIEIEGGVGESIKCENTVIATGGSMIFSPAAMEKLSADGVVIWLKTPLNELKRRLERTFTCRGVATPKSMTVEEIYEMRKPIYEKYAQLSIDCAGSTEDIAQSIKDVIFAENGRIC